MSQGHIEYASLEGTHIFKLVGEVRAGACISFDNLLDTLDSQHEVNGALVDLTQTTFIDSTVLGVLAKLGLKLSSERHIQPVMISTNEEMTTLAKSMGLNQIFMMLKCDPADCCGLASLPVEQHTDNKAMLKTVLEAHKTLASLNLTNRMRFEPLVNQLEHEAQNQNYHQPE